MDPLEHLAAQGAMIRRLSSDSRRCTPGTAFFAYPGEKADGRAHIADAIGRGAAAVLWEEAGFSWRPEWRVPNVALDGLKQRAGELAAAFHGRPAESLWVCGVTGTNGKTSSSQWIAAALSSLGAKSGVIGTLGSGYPGSLAPLPNTTPDALELQALLAGFRDSGARAVAMEVSSHGLEQGRVHAVRFRCALFTNLSHDHLDYHGSMQAYAAAKSRLFAMPGLETAVLNLDDALGARLARELAGRVRVITYGLQPGAHITLRDGAIETPWGRAPAKINAVGTFNTQNALGVLGCLLAFGTPFGEALRQLAALPPVPGRMERIGERPLVVVDYAHTPDALEKVLGALRPVAEARRGRLAVVFGAGGERDPTKRPLMGAVAIRLADRVLATSDNPRGEDPAEILRQIGVAPSEVDRRAAIERAIREAAPEDVVLIAGKGHEAYQEIAGRRHEFSDAAVARAALAQRGAA
jgi:UDP-N-acetylmuramoyl-L-alanyl-D-glutamate--2,6-diaminopimelate ligase